MIARLSLTFLVMLFCSSLYAQDIDKARTKRELKTGEKLYTKYSCISCHGPSGVLQGDLTQAYKKYTDEQIRRYIMNPADFNNSRMPVYASVIPEDDYSALIRYIKWLGEKHSPNGE